jgi:aminopeptidase N
MLHFLMTHPATGDDSAFYRMMTAFVDKHRDRSASTSDFQALASEHFAATPIAQKYQLRDLGWFFDQWVYQASLPSYHLDYQIKDGGGGSVMVSGTVTQANAPESWFMPLPLVFSFEGGQEARGTVHALGPKTNFEVKLPMRPKKIELDPGRWVLSEETTTKGK